MAYATLEDMLKLLPEQALIELTDDNATGEINSDVIAEAIANADAEIDSYLGGRYAVPLAPPAPDIVRKLSVDIALYHLYSRRAAELPEASKERYRNAVRLLEGIARGTVTLGAAPLSAASTDGASETNKPQDASTFSRASLGGF